MFSFLVGLCFVAIVVSTQLLTGGYQSEFFDPDEPAHFVTGVMVYEFLGSGDLTHPLEFAENFYLTVSQGGIWTLAATVLCSTSDCVFSIWTNQNGCLTSCGKLGRRDGLVSVPLAQTSHNGRNSVPYLLPFFALAFTQPTLD